MIRTAVLVLVALVILGAAVLVVARRRRVEPQHTISTDADGRDRARTSNRLLVFTIAVACVGGLGWLIEHALDAYVPDDAASTRFGLPRGEEPPQGAVPPSLDIGPSPATTTTATITTPDATATTATSTTPDATATTTSQPPPPTPRREAVPPTGSVLQPYSTLPDGNPVPVLATFDADTIALSGAVPSQAAADRLAAFALANSKTPATVVSSLTIDPAVPHSVGVRFRQLTSVRFPPGTAEILPLHALELDRVAAVMNASPDVTALVLGHADQRGSDASNFEFATARASTVVDYLISLGITPSRLSWRGVGESHLVSLAGGTEFIFSGLLLGD